MTEVNDTDLQKLIQNAVTTALEQSNVTKHSIDKTEGVSTPSLSQQQYQAKEMSRLACEGRLKRIGRK